MGELSCSTIRSRCVWTCTTKATGSSDQSVVRFACELVPRRRRFEVFEQAESEADLTDHLIPGDIEQYVDPLQTPFSR
jgi:hypothetical protein